VRTDVRAHLGHSATEAEGEGQGRTIRTPWERHLVDDEQVVAAGGHEPGFEPFRGAEHEHARAAAFAEPIGDREQGIDMAGGSPTGQEVGDHFDSLRSLRASRGVTLPWRPALARPAVFFSAAAIVRAKASSAPQAIMTDSNDVPPWDMNGSGTPITGRMRRTTPMLNSA